MDCPLCGSENLHRDDAPNRSYALILLGLGLLFAGRFLRPELVIYPDELRKLLILGVAVALFGVFDLFRHGNRYCGDCGYRFRARRGGSGCSALPLRMRGADAQATAMGARSPAEERPGAKYIRGLSHDSSGDGAAEEIDPNTPLEPILACLKFKNPQMRRDAARTLRKLTGQDFGEDQEAWAAWYGANKEAYWAGRRKS